MPPKKSGLSAKKKIKKTLAKANAANNKDKSWKRPSSFRGSPRDSRVETPAASDWSEGNSRDSSVTGRASTMTSREFIQKVLLLDAANDSDDDEFLDYSSDVEEKTKRPKLEDLDQTFDDPLDEDSASVVSDTTSFSSAAGLSVDQANSVYAPVSQDLDSTEIPPLNLPSSSNDLLIPNDKLLQALGIYEVIRIYRRIIRMSPFTFEDFAAALASDEQNCLIHEVHVCLMKALLREEDNNQTVFGPSDMKDSLNSYFFFMDGMIYPAVIRQYMRSDTEVEFDQGLKAISNAEYPMGNLENKLTVLQVMTDLLLESNSVRGELTSDGFIKYDDHCRVCHKVGDVLCCDACSAVYHMQCIEPPMDDPPDGEWYCMVCTDSEVGGVSDCINSCECSGMNRHDPLGFDRHHRKYWFLVRRIIIEADDGETWVVSTEKQLDELLLCLDAENYEKTLVSNINARKAEILSHMAITEELTQENKGQRVAYLDIENTRIKKREEERNMKKEQEEKKQKADFTDVKEDVEVVKTERETDEKLISMAETTEDKILEIKQESKKFDRETTEERVKSLEATAATESRISAELAEHSHVGTPTERGSTEFTDKAPADLTDKALAELIEQTPAELTEQAPAELVDTTFESAKQASSETVKQEVAGFSEQAPADCAEQPPADSAEKFSFDSTEQASTNTTVQAPADSIEQATAVFMEQAPPDSTESLGFTEQAPANSTEQAPADSTEQAPADSTEKNSFGFTEQALASSTEQALAISIEQAPADSTGQAPADSIEQAPADSTEQTLADSAEQASVDSAAQEQKYTLQKSVELSADVPEAMESDSNVEKNAEENSSEEKSTDLLKNKETVEISSIGSTIEDTDGDGKQPEDSKQMEISYNTQGAGGDNGEVASLDNSTHVRLHGGSGDAVMASSPVTAGNSATIASLNSNESCADVSNTVSTPTKLGVAGSSLLKIITSNSLQQPAANKQSAAITVTTASVKTTPQKYMIQNSELGGKPIQIIRSGGNNVTVSPSQTLPTGRLLMQKVIGPDGKTMVKMIPQSSLMSSPAAKPTSSSSFTLPHSSAVKSLGGVILSKPAINQSASQNISQPVSQAQQTVILVNKDGTRSKITVSPSTLQQAIKATQVKNAEGKSVSTMSDQLKLLGVSPSTPVSGTIGSASGTRITFTTTAAFTPATSVTTISLANISSTDATAADKTYVTRSRTGNTQRKKFEDSVVDMKGGVRMITQFKAEQEIRQKQQKMEDKKTKVLSSNKENDSTDDNANVDDMKEIFLTVKKEEPKIVEPFKLGMEDRFKHYVNQFSENPLALSKSQNHEEKERKRHLSHKFSLTTASDFSWDGSVYGTRITIVNTLRATLNQLEEAIPFCFLHSNWELYRKFWKEGVKRGNKPQDFSTLLGVLACNIKPVLFNSVWHDSLGHFALKRQTAQDREDIKRKEKLDRRKQELEEQNLQTANITYVKYTKGLKHQAHKLKGEDYRISDATGNGWRWIASTRTCRYAAYDTVGLRSLAKQTKERYEEHMKKKDSDDVADEEAMDTNDSREHTKLKTVSGSEKVVDLAYYRNQHQEFIDVSESIASHDVYPKLDTPKSKLNNLLLIRLALEQVENSKLAAHKRKAGNSAGNIKKIKSTCYSALCQSSADDKQYRCYSPTCTRYLKPERIKDTSQDELDVESKDTPAKKPKQSEANDNSKSNDDKLTHKKRSSRDRVSIQKMAEIHRAKHATKDKKPKLFQFHKYCTRNGKSSPFIIHPLEAIKIGRKAGWMESSFYHYNTKSVQPHYWPYPSPRPRFKAGWMYRINRFVISYHDVASHLRILWACLRWDDMATKPPPGGLNTISNENDITTRQIINKRNVGIGKLRSEYKIKTIIIPMNIMEQPTRQEVAQPIRSGLRKRKRAVVEAPAQPSQTILWMPEESLELWEIKAFADRRNQRETSVAKQSSVVSQSPAEKLIAIAPKLPAVKTESAPIPITSGLSTLKQPQTQQELTSVKAKLEEQLKAQRLAAQQKRLETGGIRFIQAQGTVSGQTTSKVTTVSPATMIKTLSAAQPFIRTPTIAQIFPPQGPGKKLLIRQANGKQVEISNLGSDKQLVKLSDGRFTVMSKTQIEMSQKAAAAAAKISKSVETNVTTPKNITVMPKPATTQITIGRVTVTPTPTKPTTLYTTTSMKTVQPASSASPVVMRTILPSDLNVVKKAIVGQQGNISLTPIKVTGASTKLLQILNTSSAATSTPKSSNSLITVTRKEMAVITTPATTSTTTALTTTPSTLTAAGITIPTTVKDLTVLDEEEEEAQRKKTPLTLLPAVIDRPDEPTQQKNLITAVNQIAVKSTPVPAKIAPAPVPAKIAPAPVELDEDIDVADDSLSASVMQKVVAQALLLNQPPEIQSKLVAMQRKLSTVTGSIPLTTSDPCANVQSNEDLPSASTDSAVNVNQLTLVEDAEEQAKQAEAERLEYLKKRKKYSADYKRRKERERTLKLKNILKSHKNLLKRELKAKKANLNEKIRKELQKDVFESTGQLLDFNASKEKQAEVASKTMPQSQTPAKLKTSAVTPATASTAKKSKKRKTTEPANGETTPAVSPKVAKIVIKKPKPLQNKLYCICNTPYNASEFYIGCDVCSSWFHGRCVGIDETLSKRVTSFVCPNCKKQKEESTEEWYCLCRKPYDDNEFYVGCDECEDWFHPKCVNISQAEAEAADTYICPLCKEKKSDVGNHIDVTPNVMAALKKLVKSLQTHKMGWPFLKPVDLEEVPDYYEVIKDPMDLETLATKLRSGAYKTVTEFVNDATKIFNNCRYFNSSESTFFQCAELLEKFFVQKLKEVKTTFS